MLHGSSLDKFSRFSVFIRYKVMLIIISVCFSFFCISLSRSKEEIFVALSLYRILQ